MKRGKQAVDLLHPDKTVFNMGGYIHLSGNARAVSGDGDLIQIELQILRHGIEFIPRDVLKGMLDLERKLVSRPDGPGRDARIAVAVVQFKRRAAGNEKGEIRGEQQYEHRAQRLQAGSDDFFHIQMCAEKRLGRAKPPVPLFTFLPFIAS